MQPGVCGADYAATVDEPSRPGRRHHDPACRSDRADHRSAVSVPGAITRAAGRSWSSCPSHRAMRQLFDGLDPAISRAAESTAVLQAPTAAAGRHMTRRRPSGSTAPGPSATPPTAALCSPALRSPEPPSPPIQAPGLGVGRRCDLDDPRGRQARVASRSAATASTGCCSTGSGRDLATPTVRPGHGPRPAGAHLRSTGARPTGSATRSSSGPRRTAADIDDTWFALGVSTQMGLTGEQLVALAESMQPAG